MADNINVRPSTAGTAVPVATDDVSGTHYPVYKIAVGGDGVANLASTTNPVPVMLIGGPYLEEVVDDTSPQLGGNLDLNSFSINAGGIIIDSTELGYLNGVTSNIQDQLDALSAPVFGSERYKAKNDNVITTTSLAEILNLELPFTITTAGEFRVGWCYMWNADTMINDFFGRVALYKNDLFEQDLMNHRQQPSNSAGVYSSTGSNQQLSVDGFTYIALTPGDYSLRIYFNRGIGDNYMVSMWKSNLEVWRNS